MRPEQLDMYNIRIIDILDGNRYSDIFCHVVILGVVTLSLSGLVFILENI